MRILLATPSYDGKLEAKYVDSLIRTMSTALSKKIEILPLFICGDSLIVKARNDIFHTAYNHLQNLDALFFIDADVGWEPEWFFKIAESQHDLIGGLYRKKIETEELYAFKALETNKAGDPDSYLLRSDDKGIIEVRGLGCGFMKMSKKCVKEIWDNEKSFYTGDKGKIKNVFECVINQDNHFVSEDITICEKWRALGNKVYADVSFTCTHTGPKMFTGDAKQWLQDWEKRFEEQNKTVAELKPFFKQEKDEDRDDLFKIL
jgi:glycosyltransferase involved in cell wall biosynthesis